MTSTGFISPGAMGASIAAACTGERWWASAGRSEASRARAEAAGLGDAETIEGLAERCDTIVSICPPAEADAVASTVEAAGFGGVYVDANAISPMTTTRIGERFAHYLDGGVVGPPAVASGTTRMYLSGEGAPAVAERWSGSALDVRPIDGGIGAASAVKMLFAGWTKGTSAMLLALNAAAESYGVLDELHREWSVSLPELPGRSERTAAGTAPKAWRFEGEMHEIAATLDAAGLPAEFHLGAAEVYRRMAGFKEADRTASLDDALTALRAQD